MQDPINAEYPGCVGCTQCTSIKFVLGGPFKESELFSEYINKNKISV